MYATPQIKNSNFFLPKLKRSAEVAPDNIHRQNLQHGVVGGAHTARRLELADGSSEPHVVVQDLVEGPPLHDTKLQRPDGSHLAGAHVACIDKRPVQAVGAFLEDLVLGLTVYLPENHVVARVRRWVHTAGEVDNL